MWGMVNVYRPDYVPAVGRGAAKAEMVRKSSNARTWEIAAVRIWLATTLLNAKD